MEPGNRELAIFMCCHEHYNTVPPCTLVMQGGAAINPRIEGIAYDDCGDNISLKNDEYCELTVIYNAWKNYDFEYYGFCHYRRFFCFNENITKPYLAFKRISEKDKAGFFLSEEKVRELVTQADIVVTYPENTGLSVRDSYGASKYQYKEDLEQFVQIMLKRFPCLSEACESYLGQNKQFFCNMFIMKKSLFFEYCEMLFPLLEEFDKSKTIHGSFQSDRTDGYIAERFFGIFLYYVLERESSLKIKYVSRIDTECSLKKRIGCFLLPPESRRRMLAKKLLRRI